MLGAWELTITVWQWYLKNFKSLLKVSLWLLVSLPFMLPASVQSLAGLTSTGDVLSKTPEHFEVFLFFIMMGTIVSVVTAAFVRPALIATVFAQAHDKKMDWKKAFGHARKVIWHYALVMVMVAAAVGLGFAAFFIPGIIIGTYLILAETVTVLEGEKHLDALKRSYHLVQGRFWAVLWRFMLPTFIFYVGVALISSLVIRAPLALLQNATSVGPIALKTVVTPFLVLGAIISAIATPLFLAIPVFIFKDLRKLKK